MTKTIRNTWIKQLNVKFGQFVNAINLLVRKLEKYKKNVFLQEKERQGEKDRERVYKKIQTSSYYQFHAFIATLRETGLVCLMAYQIFKGHLVPKL